LARVQRQSRLWFGEPDKPELLPQNDELIANRFGALVNDAAAGRLSSWESSPRRRLALILLLDQFPRNIYRHAERAYAQDRTALSLTVAGMQLGAEAALDPVERVFFYLPLEHSESSEVQEESVAAYLRLLVEAPEELKPFFTETYRFAREHRDVIERFGRFPQRNGFLGRQPTREETAWLATLPE
jgi:uncharacterized protein (DUF924 family)